MFIRESPFFGSSSFRFRFQMLGVLRCGVSVVHLSEIAYRPSLRSFMVSLLTSRGDGRRTWGLSSKGACGMCTEDKPVIGGRNASSWVCSHILAFLSSILDCRIYCESSHSVCGLNGRGDGDSGQAGMLARGGRRRGTRQQRVSLRITRFLI